VAIGPVRRKGVAQPVDHAAAERLDDEARSACWLRSCRRARCRSSAARCTVAADTEYITLTICQRGREAKKGRDEPAHVRDGGGQGGARDLHPRDSRQRSWERRKAGCRLAAEPVLFQEFQVTCRIRNAPNHAENLQLAAPYARAGMPPERMAESRGQAR